MMDPCRICVCGGREEPVFPGRWKWMVVALVNAGRESDQRSGGRVCGWVAPAPRHIPPASSSASASFFFFLRFLLVLLLLVLLVLLVLPLPSSSLSILSTHVFINEHVLSQTDLLAGFINEYPLQARSSRDPKPTTHHYPPPTSTELHVAHTHNGPPCGRSLYG